MSDTEKISNLIYLTDGINKFRRSRIGSRPFVRKILVNFETLLDDLIVPAFPQDELAKVSSFFVTMSLKVETREDIHEKVLDSLQRESDSEFGIT